MNKSFKLITWSCQYRDQTIVQNSFPHPFEFCILGRKFLVMFLWFLVKNSIVHLAREFLHWPWCSIGLCFFRIHGILKTTLGKFQYGYGILFSCIPNKVFRDFHPFWIFLSYIRGCKTTSYMTSGRRRQEPTRTLLDRKCTYYSVKLIK